jgi:hypothetical protein
MAIKFHGYWPTLFKRAGIGRLGLKFITVQAFTGMVEGK